MLKNAKPVRVSMLFEQINEGVWARAYLIVDETTKSAVLVDPVIDYIERDSTMLFERGLTLVCVMNTHTHADHVSAAIHLARKFGCPYLMHESTGVSCADLLVEDRQEISFSGLDFTFHLSPGHTSDAMCIEIGDFLLTGDFLFNGEGGVGRDDLPSGSIDEHWNSLQVLDRFDPKILICPGHDPPGLSESTLGENRTSNPVLQCSTRADYELWQRNEWEKLGEVSRLKYSLSANLTCQLPDPGYYR